MTIGSAAASGASPPEADALAPIVVTAGEEGRSGWNGVGTADSIDAEELRDGQLQVNLSESLARIPGLVIRNRENYAQDLQIAIRGAGSRATFGIRGLRLFVDGIPASAPDGQGQVAHFPLGAAARIDVVRGPFATLYGGSSAGVILLSTVDGSRPATVDGSAVFGPHGFRRGSLQGQGALGDADGWSWGLEATRFRTDGQRPQSAARRDTGHFKLARIDEGGRTVLIANLHDSEAQDPLGLSRADFDRDPTQTAAVARSFDTRKTTRQQQAGLAREQRLGAGHTLEAMTYVGQRRVIQYQAIPVGAQTPPGSAGGVIDLDRDYWGLNLRWRFDRAWSDGAGPERRLRLAAGLATDQQRDDRRGYENFVSEQTGIRGRLRRDERNRAQTLDPYLQADWQTGRWRLAAGLRYTTTRFRSQDHYVTAGNGDDSGRSRYEGLLPALGLRYAWSPALEAYASVGGGLETPTLNEVAYTSGAAGTGTSGFNPSLAAARSVSSEAGLRGRGGPARWTATFFDIRTRDEIVVLTNSGGRSTFGNAGRTRRQGLELAGDVSGSNWTASLAWTWLDARYRDGFLTCTASPCASPSVPVAAGNAIPGLPRQQLALRADWRPRFSAPLAAPLAGAVLGVELRHVGRLWVDDRNSDAAEAVTLLAVSARLQQTVGPWVFRQFLRLDNLTDRRHAGSVIVNDGNGRYFEPGAGRSLYGGLSVSRSF